MEKDAALLPVTVPVDSSDNHDGVVASGNNPPSFENETKRAMQSRHLMMIGE